MAQGVHIRNGSTLAGGKEAGVRLELGLSGWQSAASIDQVRPFASLRPNDGIWDLRSRRDGNDRPAVAIPFEQDQVPAGWIEIGGDSHRTNGDKWGDTCRPIYGRLRLLIAAMSDQTQSFDPSYGKDRSRESQPFKRACVAVLP